MNYNNPPQLRFTPKGWKIPVLTGVVGILAGGVLAAGITAATIEPEVRTKTVTETVTVAETPDACLEAIDMGETFHNLSASSLALMGDGIQAYLADDLQGIETANAGIDENSAEMNRMQDNYAAVKTACRNQ